jgi:prepilin-type N-terminal cleavage/methylation domain-containing protein
MDLSAGFTLVETMVSTAVLSIGLLGLLAMAHVSERGLQHGVLATKALALLEARLEAKRAISWDQLLSDDLDRDGTLEFRMRDDGLQGDNTAGDGIFTGNATHDNIRVSWTVELNRPTDLSASSTAWIEARALFQPVGESVREVRLRTMRANPRYVGWQG